MSTFLGKLFASIVMSISSLFGHHLSVTVATSTPVTISDIIEATSTAVTPAPSLLGKIENATVQTVTPKETIPSVVLPVVQTPPTIMVQASTSPSRTELSGEVTASVKDATTIYPGVSSPVFEDTLTVTNDTNSTIYIPTNMIYVPSATQTTNTPGITYTFVPDQSLPAYAGTESAIASCINLIDVQTGTGYMQTCEIPSGEKTAIDLRVTATSAQGNYALTVGTLDYSTTSSSPSFMVLLLSNNQTEFLRVTTSI